jgi:phosphatidylserine/phosphatidylglycerophosphate/cardiolipin synthase-like enzyme
MFDSAERIIRLAIQDLGPVCIPGTKIPLLGCVWPKRTLTALGKAMFERGVQIHIVLSNPGSVPGGLRVTEACYGNGWTCIDVAAEIVKSILVLHPQAELEKLRKIVTDNLRICLIRQKRGNIYDNGGTIGLHAKHFIVDDVCCYIGSQNLYICDLAEWGTIIDNEETTRKIMDDYWNPMWAASYHPEDCNVQEIIEGLTVNRDGNDKESMDKRTKWMQESRAQSTIYPGRWKALRQTTLCPSELDLDAYYDQSEGEEEGPLALLRQS